MEIFAKKPHTEAKHPEGKLRHKGKLFSFCLLPFLLACFLVFGCTEPEDHSDTGFIPTGEWSDDFGGSYKITTTNLEFDDGFGFDKFNGTIVAANDFTNNSGVLIIKVNASETGVTINNYIGVYYKDYTSSHVFLANAIDESYVIIEAVSLENAEKIFNVDNAGTHVTYWGTGYTK